MSFSYLALIFLSYNATVSIGGFVMTLALHAEDEQTGLKQLC